MLEIRSLAVTGRLESTSFSVRLGDAIVVTGPNGSGKSTLLDCISGVLKPSSGVVTIENKVQPAYLPQLPPRPFAYTVREYLMVGNKQNPTTKFNCTFDLDSLMDKEITSLSAGQWQRVAISKVLSQPSSLVLLDEPDAPLDTQWSECLDHVLSDEISEGRVIVVTLHRQDIQKSWKYKHLKLTPLTSS